MNTISGLMLLIISNILRHKNYNRYTFYSNFYLFDIFRRRKNVFFILGKTLLFIIIFSRNLIKYQIIKKF
jgi:hypothetical protein